MKDRLALERAREIGTIIFDKTGTLTRGEPVLADALVVDGVDRDAVLDRIAAAEADSEHPLARAIVAGVRWGRETACGDGVPGRGGCRRPRTGRRIRGASRQRPTLEAGGIGVPADLREAADQWAADGQIVLYGVVDGAAVAVLALEDEVRPESAVAVAELHRLGIRVAMLTGDSQAAADAVARRLGIDEVAARVLPADKAAAIARFQADGRTVGFVGDGVNDAPALAQADVGIAIGAGTDVAAESAGIVLVRSDPRDVVAAINLSRATYRKEVQNLVWATGYNLIAIPVAAGVLVPWGIDLPMSVGAIAMKVSTIIVAANAQLLRRVNLRPDEPPPAAPGRAAASGAAAAQPDRA